MQETKLNSAKCTFFADVVWQAWPMLVVDNVGDFNIICFDSNASVEMFYPKLKLFLELANKQTEVLILPYSGNLTGSAKFDVDCERLATLNEIKLRKKKQVCIVSSVEALFEECPAKADLLDLQVDKTYSLEKLKEQLVEFGYYNESLTQNIGEFSARGSLIDVYPISAKTPYRIDFFGDKIESIRAFDPNTQLSDSAVNEICIESKEALQSAKSEFISKILPSEKITWFLVEPFILQNKFQEYFHYDEAGIYSKKNFQAFFDRASDYFYGISTLATSSNIFEGAKVVKANTANFSLSSEALGSEVGVARFQTQQHLRENFVQDVCAKANEINSDIYVSIQNPKEEKLVKNIFAKEKVSLKIIGNGLSEGFVVEDYDSKNFAKNAIYLSTYELLGRRVKSESTPRRRMLNYKQQVDEFLDFSQLCEGDYLVHLGNGICRYEGLASVGDDENAQEMIKLMFEDNKYLFVPLHSSHLLSRYIGLDKRHPKLSKLDAKSWAKIKNAAELASLDYAAELLELQSKRELSEGFSFDEDSQWQRDFEDSFEFKETQDQLNAIADVKADMQSERVMERLLCADVGFGKTEIALRASFKAVLSGKQVAILAPTTILAQQHFRTFSQRLQSFGVVVEVLSRFRSKVQSTKIKAELAVGKIDILIGTHAILSKDVSFKDLGLLVIDEEHRFGVKHKEKIKSIKENVDVLIMSATPIPRTLHLAMMGAKQISTMQTPPKDRFPVETIVKELNDDVIKEAITREVERNGQVFYLHNRVKTIEECANNLRRLFPDLKIAVGHGQMGETQLERLMDKFIDGKYDILVCTTIIETGLDIPNCNTIIIEGADKFGLAQLYQLRGRVGRFTRKAYAYLLLNKYVRLLESARKRLGAIRQYTKPGAGFRIASQDLELRGCGNLLGAKQSGHITGVGFDLYCSLLKRSIALLKGEKFSYSGCDVKLDFLKMGEAKKYFSDISNAENTYQEIKIIQTLKASSHIENCYIPKSYISQSQLRIQAYRDLASCNILSDLDKFKEELKDRYGTYTKPVRLLIRLAKIRILAQLDNFVSLEVVASEVKLKSAGGKYFNINGRFPKLKSVKINDKLSELENILKVVVPSISKISK